MNAVCIPNSSSADDAQREIVEEFAFFGDWSERYQYLIDLGRKLTPLSETQRSDAHKVSGCQSQVWIVPHGDATCLSFEANSDSSIVSGLIALLLRIFSGRPAAEIAATEPAFIKAIGLEGHLSPTRSNGLYAMLRRIKEIAAQAASGARFL
jgi:cysteine desulfuration protein SufE